MDKDKEKEVVVENPFDQEPETLAELLFWD